MRRDRGLKAIGKLGYLSSGVDGTTADHDEWILRLCDEIDRRRRQSSTDNELFDGAFLAKHVPWRFDGHWPNTTRKHAGKQARHGRRNFARMVDALGGLGKPPQRAKLVGQFMELPAPTPDQIRSDMMLPVTHMTGALAP